MSVTTNRRKIRYQPDKLDMAFVMFNGEASEWLPDDVALIVDESSISGAQLVIKINDKCKPGARIKMQLGRLEPMLSEIVWCREVDSGLIRIGVRFLE
jgi:hypothetical protein